MALSAAAVDALRRLCRPSCSAAISAAQKKTGGLYYRQLAFLHSASTSAAASSAVQIRYDRGLPVVSVLLPSRQEICEFTCRPISDTVGDLCRHILQEDKGIDTVAIYSDEGVRIASSTPIEHLLQLGAFQLRINDQRYEAVPPTPWPLVDVDSAEAADAAQVSTEHVKNLYDIRSTVAALYAALNVDEHKLRMERDLMMKLEQLRIEIRPLEEKKALIDAESERRAERVLWLGLGAMGLQMGMFARLTWWEYSWDIMEPVTYFATFATIIGSFGYYILTRQAYDYPTARDRTYLSHFHRRSGKHGFDLDKYNRLKDGIAKLEKDLERLRDPLYQHLPASRLATLVAHTAKCPTDTMRASTPVDEPRN